MDSTKLFKGILSVLKDRKTGVLMYLIFIGINCFRHITGSVIVEMTLGTLGFIGYMFILSKK
jgi:hypothetical protein